MYPPIDVIGLAQRMGIKIFSYEGLSCNEQLCDGLLQFDNNDVPTIWVEGTHHENRQRFTVAHELGHLMLHEFKLQWYDTIKLFNQYDPYERQANQFAENLLIPSAMLFVSIRGGETVGQLALKYKVSDVVMENRLKNLGYL